jgi:acetylglutamate kinase
VTTASTFSGKTFVVRVDEPTAAADGTTLIDDLHVLAAHQVRPIVIAPDPHAARAMVRTINRSANVAIALSGSDAALLPQSDGGIGRVQARILHTLTGAGFIPVVEPTAFALFAPSDSAVLPDDVAAAIAAATDAARAIFFHSAGGVLDPQTLRLIDELTPSEALDLADDERFPADLRAAIRAAATGVRSGVPAAQIIDGRVAHAALVEVLTATHLGTQVTGALSRADTTAERR